MPNAFELFKAIRCKKQRVKEKDDLSIVPKWFLSNKELFELFACEVKSKRK